MITLNSFSRHFGQIVTGLLAAMLLSGCALGNIELSGPVSDPNATGKVAIHGKSIGGNLPITYAQIDLYAVDNSAYGGASHLLTTVLTGGTASKYYYPGGTTGCDQTALAPTAYVIDGSGNATYTATNSMIAGQLIAISDTAGSGVSGTYLVTSATTASFTVANTGQGAGAGTTSGTFTPVCYTHPTTDQYGNFNITGDYSCTGYGSSIVYVQNTGGNPGLSGVTTSNASIVTTALLQSSATSTTALTCSGLSSANFVDINELSTAAMGIAMGQFFTTTFGSGSSDGFGAPSSSGTDTTAAQALLGITNAANTALQLVSTASASGSANSPYVLNSGNFSVTVTPEATKLQTIGNILATCVNGLSNNSSCQSLFGALKTLPSGTTLTTPTDTLQAAVLFGLNPTAGGATGNLALWNLSQASGAPFSGISSQPSDWTIGIQYTDTSCTISDGGNCALYDPQLALTDASGNIWVLNHNSATGNITDSLTELTAAGSPVVNVSTIVGVDFYANNTRNMAIDLNGNIWLTASTSAQILEYVPGGSSHGIAPTPQPYALAIDGNNNVFVGHASGSSTYNVEEFSGSSVNPAITTIPSSTDQIEYPELCSVTTNAYAACSSYSSPSQTNQFLPSYAAVDTNGNVWFSGGSNSPLGSVLLMSGYSFSGTTYPIKGTTTNDSVTAGYQVIAGGSGNYPTFSTVYGIAAGPGGVVWFANAGNSANGLAEMTSTTAGHTFGNSNYDSAPYYPAVDGAGNVWLTNHTATSVSEFYGTTTGGATVGNPISPVKTGSAPYTAPGFNHVSINTPFGVSIDTAGNVWIANNVPSTGGLLELVGAGAPTVNPIAKALSTGKVGAKP